MSADILKLYMMHLPDVYNGSVTGFSQGHFNFQCLREVIFWLEQCPYRHLNISLSNPCHFILYVRGGYQRALPFVRSVSEKLYDCICICVFVFYAFVVVFVLNLNLHILVISSCSAECRRFYQMSTPLSPPSGVSVRSSKVRV